jgi:hypothetical protein
MGWATLSAAANRVAFDRLGSVSVVAGAASGRGFLAQNGELILNGQAVDVDYLLTVPTSTFGSLGHGNAITVDGQAYKVEYQPMPFGEGEFCRVPLIKSAAAIIPRASRAFRTGSGMVLRSGAGRALQTQPS